MIEFNGNGHPQWWTGSEFSSDCHAGIQFDTEEDGHFYLNSREWDCVVSVTEHIFMSPISTKERLN